MKTSETVYELIDAVRHGRVEDVQDFMNTHEISCFPELWGGYRLLHLAIRHEKLEMAEFLLKFDCNSVLVNSDTFSISDTSPLHIAASNFYLEIVKSLLAKGANVDARDKKKRTSLFYAILGSIKRKQPGCKNRQNARRQIIELLISHGTDVNSCDNDGKTPLHVAVDTNDIQTVEFLLDNKANIDSTDALGKTPLYYATEKSMKCRKRYCEIKKKAKMQMIELLINRGADINAFDCNGKTPLRVCVDRVDTEIVKFLLDKKANTDGRDNLGKTALYSAIENFVLTSKTEVRESLINLLLDGGADANIADLEGLAPLHVSIMRLDTGESIIVSCWIVERLLQHGANINCVCNYRDWKGFTPLHLAAMCCDRTSLVELLLKNGADVNAVTYDNKTALALASIICAENIVTTILHYAPNIENETKCGYLQNLFHKVAEDRFSKTSYMKRQSERVTIGFRNIVHRLRNYGITLDERDNSNALLKAVAAGGYDDVTKDLLNTGADVNDVLGVAVDYDETEIFNLLLEHGAAANIGDDNAKTLIFYAARNSNKIMTKKLLSSLPKMKITADILNAAVVVGNKEIVDMLFAYDPEIDVNAVDENGQTALFCTARHKYNFFKDFPCDYDKASEIDAKGEIAKLLLSKGADCEARDNHGKSVFHKAAAGGRAKIVEALLERGVDAKTIIWKYRGSTAIHSAARENSSALAEAILKYDPDVLESVNYDGETPLQVAVGNNITGTVKIFLDYGANIDKLYGKIHINNMIDAFNHHRIKLNALNRRVSEHFLEWLSGNDEGDDYREFEQNCKEECEKMKKVMIANTSVSFYDIVVKSIDELAIYMKRQSIVESLKSSEVEEKFPIFASFITTNFRRAVQRKEWLRSGLDAAVRLFGPKWPVIVLEDILINLSHTDLKNFVKACS